MKLLYKIALFLILLFWQLFSVAQTEAVVKLDTNSILIGDQTNLELTFTCPVDYEVLWPVVRDTITKNIEVIKKSEMTMVVNNDQYDKVYQQVFTITSFDSGYFALHPFRINFKIPGDTNTHFIESDVLLMEVRTVPVNTEKDIKDIKEPITAPFTFKEALPYILVFLGTLLVGFLIILFVRRRKKAKPLFKLPSVPKAPPHQIAIDALETLRFKKLWQNGEIKQYHTELTDIIREYLDGKFNINAHEFTSDEIMEAIHLTQANYQVKEKLHQTLMLADMVKFAKRQPLPVEHDTSLNHAVDFVKETIHLNNQKEVIAEPVDSDQSEEVSKQELIVEKSVSPDETEGKEVKDV